MRQIDRERPDLIIQAGIAGCFTGRPPGEVFAIRDETLADLGVWEDHQFKSLFDLGLADPNQTPFTAGRLVNPYPTLLTLTGLETVSAITVNEISTNPDRIDWYRTRTAAAIESMEGGALHYVGLQGRDRFPPTQIGIQRYRRPRQIQMEYPAGHPTTERTADPIVTEPGPQRHNNS